jgi:acetaldehyde dehydrogenase (acetylating)
VLSYYVVGDWREGCERCKAILRYGGMGHTMSVHATDDEVVLQFGLHKPAFRIVVNTPTTHGSIGLTTGLDPAMTLGCGGFGGNITSDNITPMHLINIKRLAYELRPAQAHPPAARPTQPGADAVAPSTARPVVPAGGSPLEAATLATRIDAFLAGRGFRRDGTLVVTTSSGAMPPGDGPAARQHELPPQPAGAELPAPVDFVCEDDVRQAIRQGRLIVVAARAIVTPAARELGEAHHIFVESSPSTS